MTLLMRAIGVGLVVVGLSACGSRGVGREPADTSLNRQEVATYLIVGRQPSGSTVVETLNARGRVLRVLGKTGRYWSGPPEWSPGYTQAVWLGPRGVTIGAIGGGSTRVLTPIAPSCRANCIEQSFDLSPDGKTVLVGGVGPHGEDLVTVSVATGKERVVARGGAETNYVVDGGWSPDAKSILYLRGRVHRNELESDLIVARPDGRRARVVMRLKQAIGLNASWSPDGREIAFSDSSGPRSTAHTRVGILDLTSARIRSIPIDLPAPWAPTWAPNSKFLAVSSQLGTITVAASGKRLHSYGSPGGRPVWTRAGLYILRGPQDTAVYRSSNGIRTPRLPFRIGPYQSILTFVPTAEDGS